MSAGALPSPVRALGAPLGYSRAASRIAVVSAITFAAHRRARRTRPTPPGIDPLAARALELSRLCRTLCRAQGIRVLSSGALPARASMIVANHQSYLDPVVLAALFPFAPIAKKEIRAWPVMGPVMDSLGTIFVDRANASSGAAVLAQSEETLARGVSVLCFPEGTTTDGSRLLPFRRGVFGLALATGVPVVPVAIAYDLPDVAWTGDMLFAPHYLKLSTRREVVARVRVGAPLDPREFRNAASLAEAARAEIAARLPVRSPLPVPAATGGSLLPEAS